MAVTLAELLAPGSVALVTCECQRGVLGDGSPLPELAAAARRTVLPNGARLLAAARAADVPVLHCLAGRRPDGRGSNRNARLLAALARPPARMLLGTPDVELVEEFGPDGSDLVLTRIHGLGPMAGTDLDPLLRNLGVGTLVVVGVSVNVAVTNLVMDAVNHGYRVVVARDAVAGVPSAYAEAVLEHTLALLASVVTTDELLAGWTD